MPKRKRDKAGSVRIGDISLEGYLIKKPKKTNNTTESSPPSITPSTHDREETVKLSGDPEYHKARRALPAYRFLARIRHALHRSNILILVGETGSGKSTQVPQLLCETQWCRKRHVKVSIRGGGVEKVAVGGMIAVTQPRRVAATTLARRVSHEMGTPLDRPRETWIGSSRGLVGYSVRFEHQVPRGAKIKFLTEGMLLQEFLRDPHLRQYSAVIVDEIHERSTNVDLLCGFLKLIATGDLSGRGGVPLKVIAMSATTDVEKIREFFSAAAVDENSEDHVVNVRSDPTAVELIKIEGRQFPVDVIHLQNPVPDLLEAVLETIFRVHVEEPLPGDILAFLPGQEAIEAGQKLIEKSLPSLVSNLSKINVCPLFGQLSIEAQHAAFQPVKEAFTRKVILATNIAETSVTVPGVRFVVDGGVAKTKQFRPRLGMETLLEKPISQSSAIQRAGRAGREGPGKCYRMYTKKGFEGLQKNDLPEILRNDVLGAVLTLKAMGVQDIFSFPLMDLPNRESVEESLTQLHYLDAITDDHSITDMGRRMANFPVSAKFARVLLAAADNDCLLEVIDIISCVNAGHDIFLSLQSESEEVQEEVDVYRRQLYLPEGDLLTYLTTMQQYTAENVDRVRWCANRRINVRNIKQALKIRGQLRKEMLETPPPPDPQPFRPTLPEKASTILRCFLCGFVSKTALLVDDDHYETIEGRRTVAIHPASVLHGSKPKGIMCLEYVYTSNDYAKKVSVVKLEWVGAAADHPGGGKAYPIK